MVVVGDGGVFGGGADGDGVGELEADEGLGGDLDLLAAGDGVGAGADSAAGCCSDGCAFAAAEDAAEDGAYGCSAADFFGGVLAAAFALFGVGFGDDGDVLAFTVDAGEFDGEQGAALVVGGFLDVGDAAGDGCALGQGDQAVDDDVGGDDSGEVVALLGGGAVEGLRDADGDGVAGVYGYGFKGWRRRWGGWGWGRG